MFGNSMSKWKKNIILLLAHTSSFWMFWKISGYKGFKSLSDVTVWLSLPLLAGHSSLNVSILKKRKEESVSIFAMGWDPEMAIHYLICKSPFDLCSPKIFMSCGLLGDTAESPGGTIHTSAHLLIAHLEFNSIPTSHRFSFTTVTAGFRDRLVMQHFSGHMLFLVGGKYQHPGML